MAKKVLTENIKSMVIPCVVSGIEKRVSKAAITKGVSKYGSLEAYKKHYIDRAAKKLLKQRMQPEAVQQKLLPKGKTSFSINYDVLARLKLLKKSKKEDKAHELTSYHYIPSPPKAYASRKAFIEDLTKSACMRPDIYLNNDRTCNTCMYSEFCICSAKRFGKEKKR